MKTVYPLPLLLLTLMACTNSLDRDRYVRWVESYEHGLRVRESVNDYLLEVQYKPTDYVALQRIAYQESDGSLDQVRREVDSLQYYTLTVSTVQPENDLLRTGTLAEKQRLLYYFSYELQQALHLEENGQRVPCVLYHFERSYDLKPTHTFVLGFAQTDQPATEATLIIDPPLFSPDPVRVTLRKSDIPSLTL